MKGVIAPEERLHFMFQTRLINILASCQSLSESEQDFLYKSITDSLHKTYAPFFHSFIENQPDIYQAINNLQRHVSSELSNYRIDASTVPFTRLLELTRIPFNQHGLMMTQSLHDLGQEKYEVITILRHISSGTEQQYNTPVFVENRKEFTASVTKAKRTALRGILNI
ncbi:hypothetical protein CGN00_16815 [Salmonella enterica]|uniref:hypothetical protein n=1 Tax=Salmonella enterica TaxID=28901 RepID=UPI00127EB4C5|nr:hypothetical protein [Salmonella enterica]EBG0320490.1 hypothetical protein [Salmonella enterica subsp. enterica serovar Infantis]EBU9429439.1 hypothetical protein [Salmonella enterica subsp. enterica serovar Braenderup]EDC8049117.1 hypothetical protein [Salmonella enterica subsp. enterica serovar Muenchen]EDQ0830446.1 hypothetical protein [Salmonella enterica subsp. arizonae]EHC9797975.1 hypothetical protein [Salmonella enterica subsp. enterica serovar Sandiego]